MKRAVLVLAIATATSSVATARANGRYPYASQLVVDPSDSRHVVLRTTYGFVQTFDGGKTFHWLCEKSVGYGGRFDPAIGVTKTGRILAGLFDGLTTSTDRGCQFVRAAEPLLQKQYVIDLVVEQKDPSRALALTSTGIATNQFNVIVAESSDSGASWTQAGVALPKDLNSETLEVAPSRPQRLYVSGIFGTPRKGAIEKSDDRGKTWERLEIDLGEGGLAPYLAAVDPNDPDVVYVRVSGAAVTSTPDRLLVSRDGAKTWRQVGSTRREMLGFALSPDGSKVAYGSPDEGVFVADTADPKPVAVAPISTRCLTWSTSGLYVCATEYPDDFTIGLSKDDGRTFVSFHKLSELSPLECPQATSTRRECPSEWPAVEGTIGAPIDEDGGPAADGGTSDAGSNAVRPTDDTGCGCVVGRRAIAPLAAIALLVAAGAIAARRRR